MSFKEKKVRGRTEKNVQNLAVLIYSVFVGFDKIRDLSAQKSWHVYLRSNLNKGVFRHNKVWSLSFIDWMEPIQNVCWIDIL